MSIVEKLTFIQRNLSAPKGQYNSFGKYHYRSCEDILEALKPLLYEVKAAVLLSDEIVPVGDRVYVKATATLIDSENGERVTNTAYAREDEEKKGMDGAQITGACSSYARKYALNGLFAIDDNKDADATNTHGAPPPQTPVAKKSEPTKAPTVTTLPKALLDEAAHLNIDLEKVAKYLKKTVSEITIADLTTCIAQKRKALEEKGVQG
jgi:hypothetical protein